MTQITDSMITGDYQAQLAERLFSNLSQGEILLLNYSGERSDFARMNHGQFRQCGQVNQHYLSLKLINGQRSAGARMTLHGEQAIDLKFGIDMIAMLRQTLDLIPDDPHLMYDRTVTESKYIENQTPPEREEVVDILLSVGADSDLVGIWSAGWILSGFYSSMGHAHWAANNSYLFDWSYYHDKDKAVKSSMGGCLWEPEKLLSKAQSARQRVEMLKRPAVSLKPDAYRVYLSPAALYEFMAILNWRGAFSVRAHRLGTSVLSRLINADDERYQLDPRVGFTQAPERGGVPMFTGAGFIKAPEVRVLDQGKIKEPLVSPRSAKEFDLTVNTGMEGGDALEMDAGDLPMDHLLSTLGDGLYLDNTHYLNASDVPGARVTGMTRFACFEVKDGEIGSPLNVMRFDETLYNIFGANLEAITVERERLMDDHTYGSRSTSCALLPGIIVNDFRLIL